MDLQDRYQLAIEFFKSSGIRGWLNCYRKEYGECMAVIHEDRPGKYGWAMVEIGCVSVYFHIIPILHLCNLRIFHVKFWTWPSHVGGAACADLVQLTRV